MSNQYLKLRRSAVPGKVPTTESIDYGEIALNTYDGLAFMKRSGSSGEEVIAIGGNVVNTGSLVTTSSFNAFTSSYNTGSFTGSFIGALEGTASWAYYAVYGGGGAAGDKIVTGSITASVDTNPSNLFLIKSGSTEYFNISASSNTELYSNLFIIKNFDTKQPVLVVSQSIVQFVTQSIDPIGLAPAGGIWFTSSSMYVGLEE